MDCKEWREATTLFSTFLRRTEVTRRYKSSAFRDMSAVQRQQLAETESASRIMMESIVKDQFAPLMAGLTASKSFYKSAGHTLCAMTVDNDRRRVITLNLHGANPVEIWHAGVRALQNKDTIPAASVLHVLGSMAPEDRPFGLAEFANRISFEPHEKAIQAINSAHRDTEAAIAAWQVVGRARHNPVGKIQAALTKPVFEEANDSTVVLPELEEEGGVAA